MPSLPDVALATILKQLDEHKKRQRELVSLSPDQQKALDAQCVKKQQGKCPFCDQIVAALVVIENTARRDICQCPECREYISLCRTPGCNDYAKGTPIYDHEFCPDCTSKIGAAATVIGKKAVDVAGAVAKEAAIAAIKSRL
jgi:ssDNA-binding Zn-finger/Zn-ribbon topoisomerase 1